MAKSWNPIVRIINRVKFHTLTRGYLFQDERRPFQKSRVNIHYWVPRGELNNVGDLISPVIIEKILATRNISLQKKCRSTKHLMAIGTIISETYIPTTIWGSGIRSESAPIRTNKLDVRAVRGPLTRNRLLELGINCPEVYGDPAILLPLFYQPSPASSRKEIIIPHFEKIEKWRKVYGDSILSTLTNDWQDFVNQLTSAERVISSSLHGVILAEAYGIPAILFNDLDVNDFKYRDYYQSTNRPNFAIANSVEEALSLPFPSVPDLRSLQQTLLASFPYDLWENR